ncbi:hypothetical protein [Nocardia gipuzkoensis]
MAVVIAHAADIVAWMEANLPALDPDRFEPWVIEPPVPGRPRAVIEIRIHAPASSSGCSGSRSRAHRSSPPTPDTVLRLFMGAPLLGGDLR